MTTFESGGEPSEKRTAGQPRLIRGSLEQPRRLSPSGRINLDSERLRRRAAVPAYWMVLVTVIGFAMVAASKKIVPRVSVAKNRVPVPPGVTGSALAK